MNHRRLSAVPRSIAAWMALGHAGVLLRAGCHWLLLEPSSARRRKISTWWQTTSQGGRERLTFVPAQHSSGRGLRDRNQRLWGGWVVKAGPQRFYFAGDTGFQPAMFQEIGQRAGLFDVAALPIGAHLPRRRMRREHMDPAETLQAQRLLCAPPAFGIQLGDFSSSTTRSRSRRRWTWPTLSNQAGTACRPFASAACTRRPGRCRRSWRALEDRRDRGLGLLLRRQCCHQRRRA